MRRALSTVMLLFLAAVTLSAAESGDRGKLPKVPFQVGERLEFSINWTVGNIGTAYMEVAGIDTFRARPSYRVVAEAHSNKTIDLFYPVRDFFQSLIDMQGLYTHRFTKLQREGRHRRNRELIYEQEKGFRVDLVSGDTTDIVPEAQDDLSIFYYFRTLDLKVGQGLLLENFVDREENPLRVAVLRKEPVELPVGRFDCWVVQPFIRSGGLFEHKGNLLVWITDDEHRIPVKVSSDLDFGRIVVLLEAYRLRSGQAMIGNVQSIPSR